MSVSDRLNKLTTDITNAYTSIENKGGTIPANKNTNNLPTAIDSIQGEVIETATAEGESLNLTFTKAMPYSDYVVEGKSEQEGTPSPSNPSEIYSVGEVVLPSEYQQVEYITSDGNSYIDTNLQITGDFEIDLEFIKNQSLSGEQPIISIWTPQYNYWNLYIRVDNYLEWYVNGHYLAQYVALTQGEKNQIKLKRDGNSFIFSQNGTETKFSYSGDNNTTTLKIFKRGDLANNSYVSIGKVTIKKNNILVKKLIPCYKISDNTIGMYDIINDVFISNSGTGNFTKGNFYIHLKDIITIKQSGKNKYSGGDKTFTKSENFSVETIPAGTYNFIGNVVSDDTDSNQCLVNFYKDNTQIGYKYLNRGDFNTQITLNDACNKIYLYASNNANNAEGDSATFSNIMMSANEGTYEPYQTPHDYTIQTESLRSLPNGVKDTIEADGIHRRVGRVVLDGTENWDNYSLVDGSTEIVQCRLMLSSNYKSRVGLSDRFLVIADYSATEHIVIGGGLNVVFIHINKSRLSTEDITGFKNWLSNNNIELLYELATETIEPLTQNQATTMLDIIKTGSYEGTTNIHTDEDVKPTIGVGYYKKG